MISCLDVSRFDIRLESTWPDSGRAGNSDVSRGCTSPVGVKGSRAGDSGAPMSAVGASSGEPEALGGFSVRRAI